MTGQWQARLPVWAGERVAGAAELEQQIAIAVWTPLGSIEGQPQFGSLVFSAVDETLDRARALVTREVRRVLLRWVPRAELIGVVVTVAADGGLEVEVHWRPRERGAERRELRRVVRAPRATPPAIVAPSWLVTPVIVGLVEFGATLAVSIEASAYTGTDPIFVLYAWRRGGAPITGAEAASYVVTADDLADDIDCVVTAQNAAGYALATTPSVSHASVAPAFVTTPVITGIVVVGETLTANPGTWTGSEPVTIGYAWERSGTPIVGATSPAYAVVTADVTSPYPISCRVSLTNDAGTVGTLSNELVRVPVVMLEDGTPLLLEDDDYTLLEED